MMSELMLNIVAPAKSVFKGEIKSITVPGTKGRFQVLKNHAPIVSTFEIGMIKVDLIPGSTNYYATGGGTIEVLNNEITVLADSIEQVEDIDIDRARKAKERAEQRIAERNDKIDLARAQSALQRAMNRLDLWEKYRNN